MIHSGLPRVVLRALVAAFGVSVVSAQTGGLPDYGHQWSVVTGINAPTRTIPATGFPQGRTIESVQYDYRIMTREVTVAEWYEFVTAFAPHVPSVGVSPNSSEFLGTIGISWSGTSGGVPQYTLHVGVDQRPATPGWRFGARFANWLHNGKPTAATSPGGVVPLSAFSSGAYETSTFGQTQIPPGINVFTDQTTRSEGARFWIPNMHEWVKAMYWDPDKNGSAPGGKQAGYWAYPITSDTAPAPGDPALGGQTNTGTFPAGHARPLDVGSYPDVMSPWGLLDGSGGASEWTEGWSLDTAHAFRLMAGSSFSASASPEEIDRLVLLLSKAPIFSGGGIRLASAVVPTPGVAVGLGALWLGWGGRRGGSEKVTVSGGM